MNCDSMTNSFTGIMIVGYLAFFKTCNYSIYTKDNVCVYYLPDDGYKFTSVVKQQLNVKRYEFGLNQNFVYSSFVE
jgi:hypothetical protein